MKLRVHLDTSIPGAFVDDRAPDRRGQTKEFWERISQLDATTSEVAQAEILRASDPERRQELTRLLDDLIILPLTEEARRLAHRYVEENVFSPLALASAQQLAIAVLARQEFFVSWDFKNLVNRSRRTLVGRAHERHGLPPIEICAPPDLMRRAPARYFDYEQAAREAGIPPEKMKELSDLVRQDYSADDMMYELQLLRACLAVKDGVLSIEQILGGHPAEKGRRE